MPQKLLDSGVAAFPTKVLISKLLQWAYQRMSPTLFSWHRSHLFQGLRIPRPRRQLHPHIAGSEGHAGVR